MSGSPSSSTGGGRIFVGGLDTTMTREDLEREFGKYGRLREVWMAQNPPGFAFVEFEDTSRVDDAVREMNGAILNGALLRVERARDKARQSRGGGALRGRVRRGGAPSYQAGFERKTRRTPTPTGAPGGPGVGGMTATPPDACFAVVPPSAAVNYGYDYNAGATANPYAAYGTTAAWEAPYGATYYAPFAPPGYGAYYGDFYGMAGMAAPMPVADPTATMYQQQDYNQM